MSIQATRCQGAPIGMHSVAMICAGAVDNIGIRQTLFQEILGSYQLWLDTRSEYIASITTAAAEHQWEAVKLRASRAFDFLPIGDPRRAGILLTQASNPPPARVQAPAVLQQQQRPAVIQQQQPAVTQRQQQQHNEGTRGSGHAAHSPPLATASSGSLQLDANSASASFTTVQSSLPSLTSRQSSVGAFDSKSESGAAQRTSTPPVQPHAVVLQLYCSPETLPAPMRPPTVIVQRPADTAWGASCR